MIEQRRDRIVKAATIERQKLTKATNEVEMLQASIKKGEIEIQRTHMANHMLKKTLEEIEKKYPKIIERNTAQKFKENQFQVDLYNQLGDLPGNIPTPYLMSEIISPKLDSLEADSDKWCRDNGIKPMMEIEVKKMKKIEQEQKTNKMLIFTERQEQAKIDQKDKVLENQDCKIKRALAEKEDLEFLSSLLDQDMVDMICLEK